MHLLAAGSRVVAQVVRGVRTYQLQGDQLQVVEETSAGNVEMQDDTVQHFYDLLNNRDFEAAYPFLGEDFQ